ncbi:hypothetical protein [Phytoactinopolyspora limicola]|uniref:hypothetical protein n=1 Tax=Phytoactinopolyspora limicola TaxID=2715536 RepID=UPI001409F187|nr:hypothetical protein [Phytoactinopolyspora limicola]
MDDAPYAPNPSSSVPTRRGFLRAAGLTAAGGLTLGLGPVAAGRAAAARAATFDYTSRQTFDEFDAAYLQSGFGPDNNNEAGGLAWQQSYVLDSYVKMYLAHGDTYYLDKLIDHVDTVLTHRDSERGVADYRGLSLPAWRTMHPYTLGVCALKDQNGTTTLEIRSGRNNTDDAHVTVTHGDGDTFSLVVRHETFDFTDTFDNLTMDPASPDYAVRRIYDAYPGSILCTAFDQNVGTRPAAGTTSMFAQPFIFGVHTGMITYPMASFARIVNTTPSLAASPYYQGKADEYLDAAMNAVAVHDHEWRETSNGGYYSWEKGAYTAFDGQAKPLNQTLALGRTVLEIAAATGDPTYVHRATALATMFRNDMLDHDADGTPTLIWYYFPTYSAAWEGYTKTGSPETDVSIHKPQYATANGYKNFEDYSHGAIGADFAVLAARLGFGFTQRDMQQLAATFTENVATTDADGLANVVYVINGTGATRSSPLGAARWMALSGWDRDVFHHCLAIYTDRDIEPTPVSGTRLFGVAQLNWGAHARGARRRIRRVT